MNGQVGELEFLFPQPLEGIPLHGEASLCERVVTKDSDSFHFIGIAFTGKACYNLGTI